VSALLRLQEELMWKLLRKLRYNELKLLARIMRLLRLDLLIHYEIIPANSSSTEGQIPISDIDVI